MNNREHIIKDIYSEFNIPHYTKYGEKTNCTNCKSYLKGQSCFRKGWICLMYEENNGYYQISLFE